MHDLLDSKEYKYKVGEVVINTSSKHENKIRVLKMQMDNWANGHNICCNGLAHCKGIPNHELLARNYDADVKRTDHLYGMLKTGTTKNLARDEMIEMNALFKRYGGIRKKK
jgi:hypothetical protein